MAQGNNLTSDQAQILGELQRRRSTLTPEQSQIVDELQRRTAPSPAPAPQTERNPIGEYFSGLWQEVPGPKQVLEGLRQFTSQPLETIGSLSEAQWRVLDKADKAVDRGDYVRGARHAIEFLIPVLGPHMSEIGDEAETNLPKALGRATALGVTSSLPSPAIKGRPIMRGVRNPNRVVSEAYDYLSSEGVPIPAGRRSGNENLMNIQEAAEKTMGGSRISQQTQARQADALQRKARQFADEAHPMPATAMTAGEDVSGSLSANSDAIAADFAREGDDLANRTHKAGVMPIQAGTDIRRAAEGRVVQLEQEATRAYKPFHGAAKDPRFKRTVTVGKDANGKPITESMEMPVYIGDLQDSIRPLVREWEMLVEPARRNTSRGFTAMKSILEWGKPYMPADLAEKALGGLKDLVRTGQYETKGGEKFAVAMRDTNQGVASMAVSQLQNAIDSTVAQAGPDVAKGLQEGRKFTAQQYGVADDIVSKLQAEPVNVYGQMTYGRDSGIEFVKRVAKEIPGEMPKVGRAFLGQLMEEARTPAGWKSAHRKWNQLGSETKNILYSDSALRSDIDAFFTQGVEFADTDIMKGISREPVAVFDKLTAPNDTRIAFLKRVRDIAPEQMPKVGRAYLEGLFDVATREGGWTRTQSVFNAWEKLGTETKRILFPNETMRANLDKFFLGAKKLNEPMNPSKTAMTLVSITEKGLWVSGVPSGAAASLATGNPFPAAAAIASAGGVSLSGQQIAKLLHSPRGTKLLMDGMRMPASGAPYAATTASKILEIAGAEE